MTPSNRERGRASTMPRSSLVPLGALLLVIGFTPWAWGTSLPWAQLLFRLLGLAALLFLSPVLANHVVGGSGWPVLARRSMLILILVSAASTAVSIKMGKSIEAMVNLLALAGLFVTAVTFCWDVRLLRIVAVCEVLAAVPVAAYGIAQLARPDLIPEGSSYVNRVLSSFGQPNRLGAYVAAALPVAVSLS